MWGPIIGAFIISYYLKRVFWTHSSWDGSIVASRSLNYLESLYICPKELWGILREKKPEWFGEGS